MRSVIKYIFLGAFGGSAYVTVELLFRGRSHWTMFLLGGLCFVLIGLLNNVLPWELGLVWQVLIGTAIVTVLEFATGCVVNLWLGWHVWDYSNKRGNVLGQICPQFMVAWSPLVLVAIVTDDFLRWKVCKECKPRYAFLTAAPTESA